MSFLRVLSIVLELLLLLDGHLDFDFLEEACPTHFTEDEHLLGDSGLHLETANFGQHGVTPVRQIVCPLEDGQHQVDAG